MDDTLTSPPAPSPPVSAPAQQRPTEDANALEFHAADVPTLLNEPDFQSTPEPEQQDLLDHALASVYQNDVADSDDPEAHAAFHDLATKARARITPGVASKAVSAVGGGIKAIPRMLKNMVIAVADTQLAMDPIARRAIKPSGEAPRAFGLQAKGLAQSASNFGKIHASTAGRQLSDSIGQLKSKIDSGSGGRHRATELKDLDADLSKKLATYHSDDDYPRAHGLTTPENAALLGQYIATRNPKYFDALKSNLLTTRAKADTQKRLAELAQSPMGQIIIEGAEPINILSMLVPALRGLKGAAIAGSAARPAGVMAKTISAGKTLGMGAGFGVIGKLNENPSASAADFMESAVEMALMAGTLHAAPVLLSRAFRRGAEPPPLEGGAEVPLRPISEVSASESAAPPAPTGSAPSDMSAGAAATAPVDVVTNPPTRSGSSPLAGAIPTSTEGAAPVEGAAMLPYGPPPSLHGAPLTPATAPPAVAPLSVKSVREIIRDLATGLKIPIRFGRLTTPQYGGYFKRVQRLIGSKNANDMPVVSHEVGHHIDAQLGLRHIPTIKPELMHLGDNARAGSRSSWKPSMPVDYRLGEGVAEFVRYWMIEPAEAQRLAPNMATHFESVLDANPDIGTILRQARDDVQNWRNAPSEARLDTSISVGGNPNKTRYTLPQLTRDLMDDLHMLRLATDDAQKLSGRTLAPTDNPYLLARLLRGSFGMADTFIRRGVVDYQSKGVAMGTSLEAALKPVAGRIEAFRRYLVAKRAQELMQQGRETGLVPADVNFVVQKYANDPVFQQAAAAVQQWQLGVLQYAVDSGYVSHDSAVAMMKMNQDYVPFHRVFEIGAGEDPAGASSGLGRGLNVGTAGSLKRLHGSARDIVDPLETMIKNAYVLVTASEKSAVSRAIGGMADSPGMAKWVEEVRGPMEQVKVALERVRKELEDAGADLSAVPDDLLMHFWKQGNKTPVGENIIKVTTDGQSKFYRLNSDLFQAFHALDAEDSSRLIQILSSPAQLLRAGVTLDPSFTGANLMRDAFGSAVINKYGMLPFQASIRGIIALVRNPKLVAEWAAAGAENAIEPAFFDRNKTAEYLRKQIAKDLTPIERAMVVVKSPLRALRALSEFVEKATRVGEYERAFSENLKTGMTTGDARRMAAFESRDRQDFAKGGARTKNLRHAAAFWNAGLQGNVKLYDAFKQRPTRTTLQGLAFVTIPTMLLMGLNWDDPDYWDRPQWERDAFWMIPHGKDANGHTRFLRLPKPFLIGAVFGMLPERFAQWAKRGRIDEVGSILKNMAQETVPNPLPQTVSTLFADFLSGPRGWDVFRGREIVPESIADLPPEMQWTEQTTLTARRIGKFFGFSPMKVDHIIATTTGGIGKQVVRNLADRVISAASGEKLPGGGANPAARFIAPPAGIVSAATEKFYERLSSLRTSKAGETHGGTRMTDDDRSALARMELISDAMSKLRKNARQETDETKKQEIYLRMRELSEQHRR